jgi:CheY-like chemotaxis protein
MKRVLMIDDTKEVNWVPKPGQHWDDPARRFTEEEVQVARTFEEGLELLQEEGRWDLLLLDHDLGGPKTGYDIMCFLEEKPFYCPKEIMLITYNPAGGLRMEQVVKKMEEREQTKYAGWWRGQL